MAYVWIRSDNQPAEKPAEPKKQKKADKAVEVSVSKIGDEK